MRSFVRWLAPAAAALALAAPAAAQTANYCDAKFVNDFDVVSTARHAVTNRNYPVNGLQPPNFNNPVGVQAGYRVWTFVPKERYQPGVDASFTNTWLTVTGFSQTVFLGPAVNTFPTTTETYQMETGLAQWQPYGPYFQHTAQGSAQDLIRIPTSTLTVPSGGQAIWDHSFTLATPVVLPITPTPRQIVLFCTYRGGEYVDDPAGGMSLGADWKGAYGLPGQVYQGMASPPATTGLRTIAPIPGAYRLKIGLITDEPVFHAAGYHGNQYDAGARTNERFRGTTILINDWGMQSWSGSQPTLWFDFEGGQRYGTTFGMFTVLFNMGPVWWPLAQPFNFGNLLLDPFDQLFDGFMSSGQNWTADPNGTYVGSGFAYPIPWLGPSVVGYWIKMQGICANVALHVPSVTEIALTNAISMKIVN